MVTEEDELFSAVSEGVHPVAASSIAAAKSMIIIFFVIRIVLSKLLCPNWFCKGRLKLLTLYNSGETRKMQPISLYCPPAPCERHQKEPGVFWLSRLWKGVWSIYGWALRISSQKASSSGILPTAVSHVINKSTLP